MAGAPDVDVTVNAEGFPDVDASALEAAVEYVLSDQGVAAAEISLTLLDDPGIQALNLQYLGRDRPTDVIAFTLDQGGGEDSQEGPGVLGDVYLGMEQARRQAEELGVPLEEESIRLAVHGTLHVLGHDHPEGPERTESPMFVLQESLVRRILEIHSGS